MQLAVSMLVGLIAGIALFQATKQHAAVAVWTALVMGVLGTILFTATISGWFLPEMGRFGAIGIGMMSGVETALAVGCIVRGERRALNWVAVAVSVPPILFLAVFGIGELFGPRH